VVNLEITAITTKDVFYKDTLDSPAIIIKASTSLAAFSPLLIIFSVIAFRCAQY